MQFLPAGHQNILRLLSDTGSSGVNSFQTSFPHWVRTLRHSLPNRKWVGAENCTLGDASVSYPLALQATGIDKFSLIYYIKKRERQTNVKKYKFTKLRGRGILLPPP